MQRRCLKQSAFLLSHSALTLVAPPNTSLELEIHMRYQLLPAEQVKKRLAYKDDRLVGSKHFTPLTLRVREANGCFDDI